MNHLGALVTPLVDGELSPAQAAVARAHVVGCAHCQRAVADEQAARRRTRDSGDAVAASPELTARLLAVTAAGSDASARQTPARRTPLVLGTGVALMGAFVLTLFLLGGTRDAQHPSNLVAVLDNGGQGGPAVASHPQHVGTIDDADWAIPADGRVSSMGFVEEGDASTLQVVMLTDTGEEVLLLERVGHLDPEVAVVTSSTMIGGREVYIVDGWYVLESGPCVVVLRAPDAETAEGVIAHMPDAEAPTVLDQIVAGWSVLVGA